MWKIEHRRYRFGFRQPVRTARGLWAEREGVIVRVSRAAPAGPAAAGWGEAAPLPSHGTETVEQALQALAGLEGHAADLADALAQLGPDRPAATSALCAAWAETDAAATPAERPKPLPVAALLPAGRAALEAIDARLELGFRVFKWKVGVLPPADEQSLLDDLLARLPAGARLRLDANGAWDRRTAEGWLSRAAERPVDYVEQPIAPVACGAEDLLLGLAADYPTPLALDESVNSAREVERWLSLGWRGVWVIKPALIGDPAPLLGRLRAAGADVVFGSALETRVGTRAGLRIAFAWETGRTRPPRALGYGVWPLFTDVRADAGPAAPFVRWEELERTDLSATWEAAT